MISKQYARWLTEGLAHAATDSVTRKRPAGDAPVPSRNAKTAAVGVEHAQHPSYDKGDQAAAAPRGGWAEAAMVVTKGREMSAAIHRANYLQPEAGAALFVTVRKLALGAQEKSYVSKRMFRRMRTAEALPAGVLTGQRSFAIDFLAVPEGEMVDRQLYLPVWLDVHGEVGDKTIDFLFNGRMSEVSEKYFPGWFVTDDEEEDNHEGYFSDEEEEVRGPSGAVGDKQSSMGPGSAKPGRRQDDASEGRGDMRGGVPSPLDMLGSQPSLDLNNSKWVQGVTSMSGVSMSDAERESRIAQAMHYAPTVSVEQRAAYKRGLTLAVALGIPIVVPGFETDRQCADHYALDRRTKENGEGKPGMTKPFLTRICQSVVPQLGAGVSLSEHEGNQCLYFLRRNLTTQKLKDEFDNVDMEGDIGIGTGGDWNRAIAWYVLAHNNKNVENAMVAKALLNYQLQGQTVEEWIVKESTLLQAVSRERRDQQIAPTINTLLQPGWLYNSMQEYKCSFDGDEDMTYSGFMRTLKHKAANDTTNRGRGASDRERSSRAERVHTERFRTPRTERNQLAVTAHKFVPRRQTVSMAAMSVTPLGPPPVCSHCHVVGHLASVCHQKAAGRGRGAPAMRGQPAGRGAQVVRGGGAVRPVGRGRGSE